MAAENLSTHIPETSGDIETVTGTRWQALGK